MRPYAERRLKRMDISMELAPDKYSVIAMLRELPEDARLVRVGESFEMGTMNFIFHSGEWPIVAEWEVIPMLEIRIDRDMVRAARKPDGGEFASYGAALAARHQQGGRIPMGGPPITVDHSAPVCLCDVAYTGAHRPDCHRKNVKR